MLEPAAVRRRAARSLSVGLVAPDEASYVALESFLVPPGSALSPQAAIYRATAPNVPATVDFVLYADGLPAHDGAFTFRSASPRQTVQAILNEREELALALARAFPAFRPVVVDRLVHAVAKENALFAVSTALPNVVPNLLEVPWAFGEFASDMVFLTANQLRLAFLVAAACGDDAGFGAQKTEALSIAAGALGWRALARELVSHIPFGGGLIPKAVIAYAGTFAVGKGLAYYHQSGRPLSPAGRRALYQEGIARGRRLAAGFAPARGPK
jgi:hypothetical protein